MKHSEYLGSCHCGAIEFTYKSDIEPANWAIRACQCTFCRAHSALCTSDPDGTLLFRTTNLSLLQKYRFGLLTADFLLCRNCGVYVGAVIDTENGAFGITNIHALNNVSEPLRTSTAMSYHEENTEQRTARRAQRWTPVQKFPRT